MGSRIASNVVMNSSFNDSATNNNIISQIINGDALLKDILIKVLETQSKLMELLDKMN